MNLEYFLQVGGILGLCVGVSLISAVEIVYWVLVGLTENTFKSKGKRKSSDKDKNNLT